MKWAGAVLIAGVMLAGAAAAQMGEDRSAEVSGRAYQWSLAVRDAGECREDWRFGEDGVMTVQSGREITTSSYTLRTVGGSTMLELASTRLTSNAEPDCMGVRTDVIGDSRSVYLMPLNGGGFFTCANTDTMSCYGVAAPLD